MPPLSLKIRLRLAPAIMFACFLLGGTNTRLYADEARKSSGSPLDTLMNAKFWPDIPEAKDFVKQSRPPESGLDYQALTRPGTDPVRPKPKSASELEALRVELEKADDLNNKKAGRKLFSAKGKAPRQ
jgi:hypothetical protein